MSAKIILLLLICLPAGVYAQPSSATKPVIGILGAFGEEVKLLLAEVQQKKETVIQQVRFTSGLLKGQSVVIAQTGIGKVNAAMTTTLLLEHFQPRAVIFTGIAGAINEQLGPGDLVIGTRLAHHDYGMINDSMTVWRTQNPLTGTENPLYYPCDSSLIALALKQSKTIAFEKIHRAHGDQLPAVIPGIIVTGDVFVSSSIVAQRLRKQLQADATEMEGAAVAQVCWQQHAPFIVIRSMSDNANQTAHADAVTFYKIAARNSSHLVMAMVAQLSSF